MTGERYYRAHVGSAADFGIAVLPAWEELSPREQALWEQLAFEQDLRDRRIHDRLQKKGASYDGPYSD